MTRSLEQAVHEVSNLADEEQDRMAALILDELASEKQWDEAFSRSHDALAQLAREALAEHREARTQPLEPNAL